MLMQLLLQTDTLICSATDAVDTATVTATPLGASFGPAAAGRRRLGH
jgi:hypothetical protein